MKSQISEALCVGRPLRHIPGDMSQLDVLIVTVKLWTSIDLGRHNLLNLCFGLIFFFFLFCPLDLWV